jgi:hypothetical protein
MLPDTTLGQTNLSRFSADFMYFELFLSATYAWTRCFELLIARQHLGTIALGRSVFISVAIMARQSSMYGYDIDFG